MYEYVLYQTLVIDSEWRTFFKLFRAMVPPSLGWRIQQFDWNEEGSKVEDVFINPLGVCFVGLGKVNLANDPELRESYLKDFESWIEDDESTDRWRMPIEAFSPTVGSEPNKSS